MIGIIGGGSWATAIVKILLDAGAESLNWWVRSDEVKESLQQHGRNPRHLAELELKGDLRVSTDLASVVAASDIIFLAVPSAYFEGVMGMLPDEALQGKRFVSLIKGAMPNRPMSATMYLESERGVPHDALCVVSGPSHAEEVAAGMHTMLTVASHCQCLAEEVEKAIACSYIHTTHTTDIVGVERCGLLKNIYAIAAGICQGLGYGDNINAVITCGAFGEMRKLAEGYAPFEGRDMTQPCYLGDLIVTCWSRHSRNRALGYAVAQGKTVDEAIAEAGVVPEGYFSVANVHSLAQTLGVELTLSELVYRVLYQQADPRKEMEQWIASPRLNGRQ